MDIESVEVVAQFDNQGKAMPRSFTWRGIDYFVDSIGRRWVVDEEQHILIMVAGGKVFELIFKPVQGQWYLKPPSELKAPA